MCSRISDLSECGRTCLSPLLAHLAIGSKSVGCPDVRRCSRYYDAIVSIETRKLHLVVRDILATQPVEIGCDTCFAQLDQFVELILKVKMLRLRCRWWLLTSSIVGPVTRSSKRSCRHCAHCLRAVHSFPNRLAVQVGS